MKRANEHGPAPGLRHVGLWLLAFLMALGLSWLIPPMQSPDENAHIARASLIARGSMLLELHEGIGSGGWVDHGLLVFTDAHMSLAAKPELRLSTVNQERADQARWGSETHFFPISGTGYYLPLAYAPQALGLAIGRALDLRVATSYRLARATTLLACFALLAAALRFMPPNPFVVSVLLLPMSVFQLLSPTLDGLTTCIAVLALSIFLKGCDRGRAHGAAAATVLAACVLLLATSRIQLLPLLALPFYLAWRRRSRQDLYLGLLAAIVSIAWVLFTLRTTVDLRITRSHSTSELLLHYAAHPGEFFQVVFATATHPDWQSFYLHTFIGNLGWIDTPLRPEFYPALWTGLAVSAAVSLAATTLAQDAAVRLWLVVAAVGSAYLVFLALLVTWTPHPTQYVMGVQGRYFIVPMLVLGHALSGFGAARVWSRRWLVWPVLAGVAATSLWALIAALLGRYH